MRRILRTVSISLLLVMTAGVSNSQSNSYAKFDKKGRTIGLYNLLATTTGCDSSRIFTGVINRVTYELNDHTYAYTFVLNTGGKKLTINLVLSDDEVLQPDVEDIIRKGIRARVQARQCGNVGVWTAEEIRRL